eukprot:1022081-Amphidinium_carterae.2
MSNARLRHMLCGLAMQCLCMVSMTSKSGCAEKLKVDILQTCCQGALEEKQHLATVGRGDKLSWFVGQTVLVRKLGP